MTLGSSFYSHLFLPEIDHEDPLLKSFFQDPKLNSPMTTTAASIRESTMSRNPTDAGNTGTFSEESHVMPHHDGRRKSGLSALIEAATSQLGDLASAASVLAARSIGSPDTDLPGSNHTDDASSAENGPVGTSRNNIATRDATAQSIRNGTLSAKGTPRRMKSTGLSTCDDSADEDTSEQADPRKHSFPELIMTLAGKAANRDTIAFLPDGKFLAIRSQDFTDNVMGDYFAVSTFEEFIELANDWGFSRVVPLLQSHQNISHENSSHTTPVADIEVFHHPHFVQGDWEKCTKIKFGESPQHARLHALPERTRIDLSAMEAASGPIKRRLSPGHLRRRASEASAVSPQKLKLDKSLIVSDADDTAGDDAPSPPPLVKCRSDSAGAESHNSTRQESRQSDDNRSTALTIATERLHLKDWDDPTWTGLIDRAVDSVTKTIVVDAIETLLNDEEHSRTIYRRHEGELSKSNLPGVTPISKQLFAEEDTRMATGTTTSTAAAVANGNLSHPPFEVKVTTSPSSKVESPLLEGASPPTNNNNNREESAASTITTDTLSTVGNGTTTS